MITVLEAIFLLAFTAGATYIVTRYEYERKDK